MLSHFHIKVTDDIGALLFGMLVLRGLQDSEGNVWRCNLKNLSLVEVILPEPSENKVHHSCIYIFNEFGVVIHGTQK